jgi:hypothetical protein
MVGTLFAERAGRGFCFGEVVVAVIVAICWRVDGGGGYGFVARYLLIPVV